MPNIKKVKYTGSKSMGEELTNHSIVNESLNELEITPPDQIKEALQFYQEIDQIKLDPDVGAVVTGFDTQISYNKLALASLYL